MTIAVEVLHDILCKGSEVIPHRVTEGLEDRFPLVNANVNPNGELELNFDDGADEVSDVGWRGEVMRTERAGG